MHTPSIEGRSKKFPWYDRVSIQIPRYASLTKPLRELTHKEAKFHWGREEDDAFEELKANISSKDTMAFFNPKLPIMVRVEASYNEGLSAGLFQQSAKGWQPVHFISRTLTDVEKRYSQRRMLYVLNGPKIDFPSTCLVHPGLRSSLPTNHSCHRLISQR